LDNNVAIGNRRINGASSTEIPYLQILPKPPPKKIISVECIKKITPTGTAGATTKKLSYENKNFFSLKINRAILRITN
jgi:hypothetical protein